MRQQVERGEQGVRQRVEILVANGGQVEEAHAAVDRLRMALAAIDGHLMPARSQTGGEIFGEGFEAAIAGWNAARAKKGYPHFLARAGARPSRAGYARPLRIPLGSL